jgi:hypothetical protein
MQTVEQFIDKLGGTVAVATALDLTASTVSSWKTSGSIPKWRLEGLRMIAKVKQVDMPDEFAPVSKAEAA